MDGWSPVDSFYRREEAREEGEVVEFCELVAF
jgi:hypothetical protein